MSSTEQLFENLIKLKKIFARNADQSFEDRVATRLQFATLSCIQKKSGLSVKELGQELSLSMSSTTQLLERLDAAQCLERIPDASDRRKQKLQLTEKGQEELARLKEIFLKQMDVWLGILNKEEQEQLSAILTKLITRLKS